MSAPDPATPDPAIYVDAAAAALDLPIAAEHRPCVIDNFARIAALAALVTGFALPADTEPAPVFKP